MTRPATPTALARRVAALEANRSSGPLTKAECRELAALDDWYVRRFNGTIDQWSDELLEEFFQCARGHDEQVERYFELRQRDPSPERNRKNRQILAMHLGISPEEVDDNIARAIAALTGTGGTP